MRFCAPSCLVVRLPTLNAAVGNRGLFLANAESPHNAARLYLPDFRSDSLPSIVVVVDLSASTQAVLPEFKTELQSIVDECQPESTIVIMADAKVQRVDEFLQRGEAIEFNVEGFGGTDFRPAFGHVDQQQLNPACLIYLTDEIGRAHV